MKYRVLSNVESGLTVIKRCIAEVWNTPTEANNAINQVNSLVVTAIDRYSASALERETVGCFFVFQETGDPPSVTKHPVRDRLVKGQAPQSAL